MNNLTSEDRFNHEMWHVLDKINYELLINRPERTIKYIYNQFDEKLFPVDRDIFRLLENDGIIKRARGLGGDLEPDIFSVGDPQIKGLIFHFIVTDKFESYYQKYKLKLGIQNSDVAKKLILFANGKVVYITAESNQYNSTFSRQGNEFRLLKLFGSNPHHTFDQAEMERDPKLKGGDRQIRDIVGYIKKRMKLNRNNSDDFFLVDKGTFGIDCDFEIREK